MAKTIENLFYVLHFGVNILAISLFFLFYRQTKRELPLALIAIYLFFESVLNIITEEISNTTYSYLWSSFTIFEYCVFAFILYRIIKRAAVKRAILYISVGFIVFTVVYNLATNFKLFDSIPVGLETILILLFAFYYLYEQIKDPSELFIYNKYQFWTVIGLLIYLSGSFFVFIFASRLSDPLLKLYWLFANGFYFLMVIFFSVAMIVCHKQTHNKPSKTYLFT